MRQLDGILIRTGDIVLSLAALCILAVPIAIIALLIKLEDGGSALFRQKRVGKGGVHFMILKFRSMSVDPRRASGEFGSDGMTLKEARARFQTTEPADDPRITRMGKLLRASHLDELPQFVNVLRGDMSIVGVRPDTPVQEADYSPEFWSLRQSLRPGMTGPAQLQSGTTTLALRSALDMTWIEQPKFSAYVRILFATVLKVLRRTGN